MDVKLAVGDVLQIGYYKSYTEDRPYHLQVGDLIKLVIANRPELLQEIPVLPDGTCVLPLLGPVPVRGKTVGELREELNRQYSAKVKTPTVDLLVVKARSAIEDFFRILADGAGGPVREVTLTEHGIIDLPLISQIKALGRPISEVRQEVQAAYAKALPDLQVTFTLTRRLSQSITVLGEVNRPGSYNFSPNTSAMRALALAGGVTDRAWTSQVIVVHAEVDGSLDIKVHDLSETFNGQDAVGWTTYLAPHDLVYIPMSPIADANVFVQQYIRNMLPFQPAVGFGIGVSFVP